MIEDLDERKICFVPHALTSIQREQRISAYENSLEILRSDKDYLRKIITGDENWYFSYDSKTERQIVV